MNTKWTRIVTVAVLSVGAMFAQSPRPRMQGRMQQPGMHLGRMADELGLTDEQKAQAKEIFQSARQTTAPLHQQMRDARKQLADDVKTNASQDVIAKDSSQVGALSGQLAAQRAQTFQKFYGILTDEQKAKLDTLRTKRRTRQNG
jgi:periplasmic protein CpxP/Spy